LTGVFVGGGWEDVSGVSVVSNGFDSDTKGGLELNRGGKTNGSFGGGLKENAAGLVGLDDWTGELNGSADVGLNENAAGILGWVGWEGGLNIGSELDVTVGIGLGDKSGALGLGDSVDCKRAAETGVGLDVSFGGGWREEFGV
jgi:hypothetical protein